MLFLCARGCCHIGASAAITKAFCLGVNRGIAASLDVLSPDPDSRNDGLLELSCTCAGPFLSVPLPKIFKPRSTVYSVADVSPSARRSHCPSEAAYPQLQPVRRRMACLRATRPSSWLTGCGRNNSAAPIRCRRGCRHNASHRHLTRTIFGSGITAARNETCAGQPTSPRIAMPSILFACLFPT